MPTKRRHSASSGHTADEAISHARTLGTELAHALIQVLRPHPDRSPRPTSLAAQLGVSRVLISRTLNAIKESDPLETLHRLPGPESLRVIVEAAHQAGASNDASSRALAAVDQFGALIRDRFSTRSAFHAAICNNQPQMQRRIALDSRQRVFKGMRELCGVAAECWLSTTIVVPDVKDPSKLNAMMLQGFIGLRKLRLDVPVAFSFEAMGAIARNPSEATDIPTHALHLEDLYSHSPAMFTIEAVNGQKVYRLQQDRIGKESASDMLALISAHHWRSRFQNPDRPLTGAFAQPPSPVKMLLFDVLLAKGICSEASPQLFVYPPSTQGSANVNDRNRDIDRVSVPERVERLTSERDRLDVEEIPNYRRMLERVTMPLSCDLDTLEVHRVRIAYPPFGFQFVSTFELLREAHP